WHMEGYTTARNSFIQSEVYSLPELLSDYLGMNIDQLEVNKADMDGSIMVAGVLLLNVEVKTELGPHLRIAGATYIDKIVCDLLTPILPLYLYFLPHEWKKMEAVACAVHALKNGITELKFYYSDYQYQELDNHNTNRHHQLQFLYIDFVFVTINDEDIPVTYMKQFNSKLLFVASLDNNSTNKEVLLKFVQTYSEDTHKICSDMDIAPKLLAVNVITGSWKIIVMSLLGQDFQPLSEAGYVHGDLRGPNIMVSFGQESNKVQVKLVNFDWAGQHGDMHYSLFMNMDLKWHPNVKVGVHIEREHDLFMVNQLYNDVTITRADKKRRK
ncbi:6988_t:CDS:2, partial [Paraglomus occultum]